MTTSPDLADLADLEDLARRLTALLDPYRGLLVPARIYGLDVLARPGGRKHDWFAGVQLADGYVKLNFLPMHSHPEILDGLSAGLRKRKTGASVFRFTSVDDAELEELAAMLARGFAAWMAR